MEFKMSRIVLLLVVGAALRVQSNGIGPPSDGANRNRVCNDMSPGHGPAAQPGNGGYTITTDLPRISETEYAYVAGQTYSLTLSGPTFRGFLVIAHVPGQRLMLLGQFATGGPNQQIIDCDTAAGVNTQASIGHMRVINEASRTFTWTAPSDSDGMVDFRFTVVQTMPTFYVMQSAAQTSTQAIVDPTAPIPTTEPPVPPIMRDPEEYRLTFRQPANCLLEECNAFVGIDTNDGNPNFLDITMQGVTAGWVAVGFSPTRNMDDADVVGCIRNSVDDSVVAIDTYNALPGSRSNLRDNTQDVTLFNSSFVNGTISCTFARPIIGSDPSPQDRPLNSNYWIMYGYGGTATSDVMSSRFLQHEFTPSLSAMMLNPENGNNQPFNGVMSPVRDPEDYRLTFRTPEGCNVSNCTSFIGIDTNTGNNGVLDIYMEGEARGWVAVGFTATQSMADADVVACNRDPNTDVVEALDTYNLPASEGRNNSVDVRQNVRLFNSSFNGTRISCTVGKEIAPSDPVPQDVDLTSNNFVLWGIRADDSDPNRLLTHGGVNVPTSSQMQVNPAGLNAGNPTPPVRQPLEYRLRIRDPPDCTEPSTCDLFVGVDTNAGDPAFLDIYIEGEAQGWVALGASDTPTMFSADVVGCNRDPNNNDMIEVVDTWNFDPDARSNTRDAIQDVIPFSGQFANGRITCTFAKRIAASGANEDLSLDTSLFVMYGVGPNGNGAGALLSHDLGAAGNPLVSSARVVLAQDEGDLGEDFPREELLRAHGILMLIAWPLLAVSGIFFAAWMRPALPNGEWFQIHRAFLLSSLFVGALGFLLAFVAHARNPIRGLINLGPGNPVGTTHFAFGILVMLLHILNPLIAVCRCHPGDKFRWVFNLLHGTTIGLLAEILALINISLGLVQFGSTSIFGDLTIFWVFIGFLIFFLVLTVLLFIIFTILSLFSDDDDRSKTAPSLIKPLVGIGSDMGDKPALPNEGVELAVPGEKPTVQSNDSEKPKVPSKDSPLRWAALTLFLAVNVIMMIVLIILIAVE